MGEEDRNQAGASATLIDPEAGEPGGSAPALGHTVGRGMAWMMVHSLVTKGASLVTLVVLGWLLGPRDYGLYALAFSFAAIVQVFRDGGAVSLLIQRGEAEYRSLVGPVFWMSLAVNIGAGLLLAGIAPVAAGPLYEQPALLPLLLVIAVTWPLATPGTVLMARLQQQLRFDAYAKVQICSALIRYASTIALAKLGAGPLSFVAPLPVMAVFEAVAGYVLTREKPWAQAPELRRWREVWRQSKWVVVMGVASSAVNQGAYLVVGAILTVEAVGVFSFAFQLVGQVESLLAATATSVLFPALTRLNTEPERQQGATLRAMRVLVVIAAVATFGLVVTIEPLQRLGWGSKWAAAVLPVQALALLYAGRVVYSAPVAAVQARGQFRLAALIVFLSGLGMMVVAGASGVAWRTPEALSMALGLYYGVGFMGFTLWAAHVVGLRPWAVLRGILPAWLCVAAAGGATLLVGRGLMPVLHWDEGRLSAAVEAVTLGGFFCAAAFLLVRLVAREQLRDLAGVLPARVRGLGVFRWAFGMP